MHWQRVANWAIVAAVILVFAPFIALYVADDPQDTISQTVKDGPAAVADAPEAARPPTVVWRPARSSTSEGNTKRRLLGMVGGGLSGIAWMPSAQQWVPPIAYPAISGEMRGMFLRPMVLSS